jgi:pimeloyl-ACP methyl ester carboxylesterase
MTEHRIDGPQGALNLSDRHEGEGVPVLFVHSDGGSLHHWDTIRARLKGRPTAAFDRRGHGRSGFPESGSFTASDAASDIDAVADELGYERFFLVGHSGGALVSLAFAAQEPDRVLGLVLVDPPGDPAAMPEGAMDDMMNKLGGDSFWPTVEGYYRSIAGEDKQVVERILHDARATPKDTILGLFEANSRFNPREYAGYDGPALCIIQSQFNVDSAIHRILRMEHIAIDGAGHWIHLGAQDRFLDCLEEFIADHEEQAASVAAKPEPRQGAAD